MEKEYLSEFSNNAPVQNMQLHIKDIEDRFNIKLPEDYIEFMERYNGGEGCIGESYIVLYSIEEIIELNEEYEIELFDPNIVLIGSNGAGEAFAFDYRHDVLKYIMIPFIFEVDAIIELSDNMKGFFSEAFQVKLFG